MLEEALEEWFRRSRTMSSETSNSKDLKPTVPENVIKEWEVIEGSEVESSILSWKDVVALSLDESDLQGIPHFRLPRAANLIDSATDNGNKKLKGLAADTISYAEHDDGTDENENVITIPTKDTRAEIKYRVENKYHGSFGNTARKVHCRKQVPKTVDNEKHQGVILSKYRKNSIFGSNSDPMISEALTDVTTDPTQKCQLQRKGRKQKQILKERTLSAFEEKIHNSFSMRNDKPVFQNHLSRIPVVGFLPDGAVSTTLRHIENETKMRWPHKNRFYYVVDQGWRKRVSKRVSVEYHDAEKWLLSVGIKLKQAYVSENNRHITQSNINGKCQSRLFGVLSSNQPNSNPKKAWLNPLNGQYCWSVECSRCRSYEIDPIDFKRMKTASRINLKKRSMYLGQEDGHIYCKNGVSIYDMKSTNIYLQVDLLQNSMVTAVSTAGKQPKFTEFPDDEFLSECGIKRYKGPKWKVLKPEWERISEYVAKYELMYRKDGGKHWTSLGIFKGNSDPVSEAVRSVLNNGQALECRYLRFYPLEHSESYSMRVAVFGYNTNKTEDNHVVSDITHPTSEKTTRRRRKKNNESKHKAENNQDQAMLHKISKGKKDIGREWGRKHRDSRQKKKAQNRKQIMDARRE